MHVIPSAAGKGCELRPSEFADPHFCRDDEQVNEAPAALPRPKVVVESRNNVVVALLTNAEGWQNNHHASPRACSQGHRWWELDLTFTAVRVMQLVGLARDVVPVQRAKHVSLTR